MPSTVNGAPTPKALNKSEARALFDERARRLVGVSGAEFRRRWEAGEYAPDDDQALRVAMLLPFGR